MTEEMIQNEIEKVIRLSNMFNIAWLLSDGENLKAVGHEMEKYFYTNERNGFGYWVAAVYERGHKVEA